MNTTANVQQAANEFYELSLMPVLSNATYENLVQCLCERINVLIKNNFEALVQLLYRMDIPEQKLRQLLNNNTGEMAANIIAKLMIERQLQKIETRRLFKNNESIPDDEKW